MKNLMRGTTRLHDERADMRGREWCSAFHVLQSGSEPKRNTAFIFFFPTQFDVLLIVISISRSISMSFISRNNLR